MSIKLPKNIIEKGFLQDFYKDRKSLGIILNDTGSSQLAFEALHYGQTALDKTNEYEIVYFCQDWVNPIIRPSSGMFHTSDLLHFKGDVICPSVDAVADCTKIYRIKNIIWYIYNIHELYMYDQEEIQLLLKSEKIKKITRCKDYNKILKQTYQFVENMDEQPIENFNLEKFIERIYG